MAHIGDALRQESSVHIQVAHPSHYEVSVREAGTGTTSHAPTRMTVFYGAGSTNKQGHCYKSSRSKQAHRSARLCRSHTTHPPVTFDGGS